MIRETEPPKPSTRLQTLGDKLTEVAKRRHTEPPALSRLVRGDLDWIVMKALEKDRTAALRNGQTGWRADLQRHLNNEPVSPRPPSSALPVPEIGPAEQAGFGARRARMARVARAGYRLFSTWQALRASGRSKRADPLAGRRGKGTPERSRATPEGQCQGTPERSRRPKLRQRS